MENLSDKIYEWIPKSRNDELPSNAIYGGSTNTDGHVYVGRFNNIPGKVNLSNKKIYNFWVQPTGNRQHGEVLVTDHIYKWIDICHGDKIPKNAIYSGKDKNGDKVWVGREISGEPGKINCHNNNSSTPLMHNLWYGRHSNSKKAHILIIEKANIDIDENETEEEKVEEKRIKNNKLEYLHSNKEPSDELPLWKYCIVSKLSKTVKSSDLKVSVGNLAKNMFDIISSVDGNIITLANLITKFNLHLTCGSSEELTKSKEFIITPKDKNGYSKYVILIFRKVKTTKTRRIMGIYNTSTSYLDIKIDYMVLESSNYPAELKCQELIDEKTSMVIDSFRP